MFGSALWGSITGAGGNAGAPVLSTPLVTLLKAMLRKAGVTLAPGRGPSPDQLAEAIGEVNRMVGGLNLNPLLIFTQRIDVYNTVSDQKTYTLGPGGDWDAPRPQKISFANLFLPTSPVVRREIKVLSDEQWQRITFQDIFTYPAELYNDGSNDNGRCTIYLHPVPDAVYQIELYTWQSIPQFIDVGDTVVLPQGYEDVIVNNGAVRLASMPWPVQRPMDPQVRIDADRSLALLQAFNAKSPRGQTDPALRGGRGVYNYLSGLVEP